MPKFDEWLFGSAPKIKQKPTGTQEQMQFGGKDLISMLQQMMNQGGLQQANQYDQNLLGQGPEAFQKFSEPYNQQFNEKILPGIAERFAGMGALSSSGFGQAIGAGASDFQSQLAQLFSSLQGGAASRQQGQFQGLAGLGLGYSPFAYHEKQGTTGFAAPFLTEMGKAGIKAATGGFGG